MYRGLAYQNQNRSLSSTGMPQIRRATMAQYTTLYVGMDVHTESIAIAYVAQEHGAEAVSRGPIGTRQCDIAKLIRQLQSKSQQLIFVYEAGPYGFWLYRYLKKPLSGHSQSAPATAPGKAPRSDAGHQREDPGPALQTVLPAAGQRQNCQSGRRRPCSGTGRLHVGHGHAGCRATQSIKIAMC
jgi:hypothetical protein